MTGKAWQRQMRERIACEEQAQRDAYWEKYDLDISAAAVRPVDYQTARGIIMQYEWLGKMPAIVLRSFGIFFGDVLGDVVTYSPDSIENRGVWDRYGYTGKIVLLSRGACTHWAHPHSASKLIRGSMRLLPERYEVVTATVDSDAGEVGTIYQACGFDYIPRMPSSTGAWGAVIGGKAYTSRSLMRTFHTKSIRKLRERFGDDAIIPVREKPKGRYFAFRGSRSVRNHHRAAIAHLVQPYPRRDPGAPPADVYEVLNVAA